MITYFLQQLPQVNIPSEAFQTEVGVFAVIVIGVIVFLSILVWVVLRPMNKSIDNLETAWAGTRTELDEEKIKNSEYREKLAHSAGVLEGVKALIEEIPDLRKRIRELDDGFHEKDKALITERTQTEAAKKYAETVSVEFVGALQQLTSEIRGWREDLETEKKRNLTEANEHNKQVIQLLTVISERVGPKVEELPEAVSQ